VFFPFFSAPEDFRVNPGAVEALAQHPTVTDKVSRVHVLGLHFSMPWPRVAYN
jgi:hypothetical protein